MTQTPPIDRTLSGSPSVEDAFIAFQNLTPDGFMMFQPVRAADGEITDLEWTFVNQAAGDIIGREPNGLVGKKLLVEMPGNKDEGLFDAYRDVIETGQTWQQEFHYDHGGITAWFRVTAAKSGDGLALSFANISETRKVDERLKALIDSLTSFVGVLSLDGILMEANERAVVAAGVQRNELIGRHFWDCYWWSFDAATMDRLKKAVARAATGELVRYDAEIRVAGDNRMWIDFQLVPVISETGEVTEIIPSGVDISERKEAEKQKELLINELSHRVKNTLATIQSMAGQTIRSTKSTEEFRDSFNARLRSIAASHDLLVASEHPALSFEALVKGQVMPYAADEARVELVGEGLLIPGELAHSLGLVLHELAANASKYGALSTDRGTVAVDWHVEKDEGLRKLYFNWQERGGPRVKPPTHRGFGTKLIQVSLGSDDEEAILEYPPEGVSCRLVVPLT